MPFTHLTTLLPSALSIDILLARILSLDVTVRSLDFCRRRLIAISSFLISGRSALSSKAPALLPRPRFVPKSLLPYSFRVAELVVVTSDFGISEPQGLSSVSRSVVSSKHVSDGLAVV